MQAVVKPYEEEFPTYMNGSHMNFTDCLLYLFDPVVTSRAYFSLNLYILCITLYLGSQTFWTRFKCSKCIHKHVNFLTTASGLYSVGLSVDNNRMAAPGGAFSTALKAVTRLEHPWAKTSAR